MDIFEVDLMMIIMQLVLLPFSPPSHHILKKLIKSCQRYSAYCHTFIPLSTFKAGCINGG